MTKCHLVVVDKLDISKRRTDSAAGLAPRHFFIELADVLKAELYEPDPASANSDKPEIIHKILNIPPHLVELSRRVVRNCADEDVIFCIGEIIALPIAHALKKEGKKTRLVSFGHNLYRPRVTVANILWGCRDRVDKFLVFTEEAAAKSGKNKMYFEQTDDQMFSPASARVAKPDASRPVIVSVGLEKRDNLTLAEATRDMDVDVCITAFSRDAQPDPRASPDPLPDNMTAQFYPWPDLVDLYRSADLVVVPIVPTNYAAGINAVLEGAAVGKPIIATGNESLIGAVADPGIAIWVPPENPDSLKQAILDALADPEKLGARGEAARQILSKHHSFAGRQAFVIAELQA